ncbi:hypothetical protein TRAPUB_10853 [Trametes pubescens]|uniref:Uncharacterized protein n=1 Tax=Trametes pubescens TaxID=154538 RepID=A0A1M2VYL0_TRAPU|nr:hypothetical protein TRAPUB_10853 [Trametes pubescens]
MRSPALAFSLFAVAATVSAQSNITQRSTLEQPNVHANVGSYQMQTPKEMLSGVYPRAEYRGDQRQNHGATREGRPGPPHVNANHGVTMGSSAGDGVNGGVSDTAPAVGADAGDGSSGSSSSSSDSGPASGTDIFNVGNSIQNALGADKVSQSPGGAQSALAAPEQADAGYKPSPGYTYSDQRMKRSRVEPAVNVSKRQLGLPTSNQNDNSGSDDNSNQDGADGTSQRGSETDGAGPNGGEAHSGNVGSSKGGRVINDPASSSG